jgi:ABC-type transport system substrate-binding protein
MAPRANFDTLRAMDRHALARNVVLLASLPLLAACGRAWNDPYPAAERGANILYSAFSQRPKHLDPAKAYASDEYEFISQVYEPPLQYHYLKRPYVLVPATAAGMPRVLHYDARDRLLPQDADARSVAYSVYELRIRPGIRYAPHPAFARDDAGKPLYLALTRGDLRGKSRLLDFPGTGTRELTARDYIYQIKRLAHPRVNSPILGHMSEYIVGLKEYSERLVAENRRLAATRKPGDTPAFLELDQFEIAGVTEVDRYAWRIRIKGKYPQFIYWLAMPFFAPVPVEADRFYSQPGMAEKNITLDWFPVGTGPYMLNENDPNARMVLERNPCSAARPIPPKARRATRRPACWPMQAVRVHSSTGSCFPARRRASHTGTSSCRATTTSPAYRTTTSTTRSASPPPAMPGSASRCRLAASG